MRAKKSLGQNFLKSQKALKKIIEGGRLQKEDTVLEVGPGKGVLTEKLLEKASKVVAVEKDDRLIELLSEKFSKEISKNKLEIIHQDILEFDPTLHSLNSKPYKLIANIPYYITGAFLKKFLSGDSNPLLMVILVQKEVAERVVSDKGSLLSIGVKAYGEPKIIQTVPARYFNPPPKVDSAILLIENISKEFFRGFSQEVFWQILKSGFSQKRKKLIRNLEKIKRPESLKKAFAKCSIEESARAENLSLNNWKCLVDNLDNLK